MEMKKAFVFSFILFLALTLTACTSEPEENPQPPTPIPTPTEYPLSFRPKFLTANFIELDKIEVISLFRSSAGHEYKDEFESCRSMKHYFRPYTDIDWTTLKIYSPLDGKIVRMEEGWAGYQIHIQSDQYPQFTIILFHVAPHPEIKISAMVVAGQEIGAHASDKTSSDIAVARYAREGYVLISFFEVITDEVFAEFQARGVTSREDLILTKEQRDADPLTCDGETFTALGTLPVWFNMSDPIEK